MSQIAPDSYAASEAAKNRQLSLVSAITFGTLLLLLAVAVYFSTYAKPSFNPNSPEAQVAAAQRIQKVGSVELKLAPAARATPMTGEEAYKSICMSCHDAGVAGAPKLGDNGAWGPRIGQGVDTLFKHAIEGFTGTHGVMPAKGGNPDLSDDEVKRAVVYLANHSGASFAEPAITAASGAADGASGAASAAAPAASAASN